MHLSRLKNAIKILEDLMHSMSTQWETREEMEALRHITLALNLLREEAEVLLNSNNLTDTQKANLAELLGDL